MKTYIFINDKNKNLEEIKLIYIEDSKINYKTIGDIYNLIEYINNNIDEKANVKFLNFKIDKLNFIMSSISRFKNFKSINEYNDITISKKKRIRGR